MAIVRTLSLQENWKYTHFLHLDKPLLLGILLLASTGLIVLYSASGQDLDTVTRQAIRLGLGFVTMLILAQIHIQNITRWVPWFYFSGIILLILVLIIGDVINGSQRWINLGLFRFQPSEMMKLAVPLMVAWYLSDKTLPPNYQTIAIAIVLTLVPALLIADQPDLGTALLITAAGMFVLLLSGIHWYLIVGSIMLAVISAPVFWYILHDYQQQRILTLLNPEADPLGTGYHIIQSKIAIGSGGIYGKGWLNGTQSHLEFLPECSTDFIFAVYGEEFGLVGSIFLLGIYLFILTRGVYIAVEAQDTFARLIAGSLIFTFFVYIFVNMGMVIGLLPVVGLPLPLISYGGTSSVTLMAGFGLLMAVHTHRRFLNN